MEIKESAEEEVEDLDVNMEGTEDLVAPTPSEEYKENEEESEEEADIDFEELPLDDFQSELELDDFGDEH